MQFIPSTWSRFSRDGDGDGVKDPHDIDDAAASAAAYLCFDGHDLTTSSGWNAAIFSYNHDNGYVNAVYAAANRYGLAVQ
ncbi:lytic murein transglycosylase [Nocardioides daphniae]|nr:lytic murein transglycosylase [Nocardioides daphniae]